MWQAVVLALVKPSSQRYQQTLTAIPEQVALVFMELYSELGDNIALQYGGSEAHKKVSGSSGPGKQVRSRVNTSNVVRISRYSHPPEIRLNSCSAFFKCITYTAVLILNYFA